MNLGNYPKGAPRFLCRGRLTSSERLHLLENNELLPTNPILG